MRRAAFALALAAALCGGMAHAGPFGGSISESVVAKDMNAAGDTVLESITGYGARRAFLRSGGMRYEIGTFGGEESRAAAINSAGVVTGSAQTADFSWRAYRFDIKGGLRMLDTLGGASSAGAAINESGHIVGHADTYDGSYHAFVDTGITMLDLGTFGGKNSYALGINAHGVVVGAADRANGFRRAFIYKPGVGKFEIPDVGDRHSVAMAINDQGVVAGTMQMPDRSWHAFTYDGTRTVDLGLMMAKGNSFATAINNRGDVVGNVRVWGRDTPLVFAYSKGQMQVRDNFGNFDLARRIGDDGQIIGAGAMAQRMRAARISHDKLQTVGWPKPLDLLTYAFLAILATFFLYKIREHLREGADFSKRMLILSIT
ncbi:DUF3466 family protein [Pseudoduganella violaceinigra]|uniref:DUF3466 family protein n=1 Tax=Pseudoduganella violaceinigra TaxID=246602 RepID=UPI0004293EE3|nr:DUF3466 family protein [Pseudoduganella violaceinigra]